RPERIGELVIRLAVDPYIAGARRVQAEDHPHGGGLPGSVGAEKSGHATGLDGERSSVDRNCLAVALGEELCLDHLFVLSLMGYVNVIRDYWATMGVSSGPVRSRAATEISVRPRSRILLSKPCKAA